MCSVWKQSIDSWKVLNIDYSWLLVLKRPFFKVRTHKGSEKSDNAKTILNESTSSPFCARGSSFLRHGLVPQDGSREPCIAFLALLWPFLDKSRELLLQLLAVLPFLLSAKIIQHLTIPLSWTKWCTYLAYLDKHWKISVFNEPNYS